MHRYALTVCACTYNEMRNFIKIQVPFKHLLLIIVLFTRLHFWGIILRFIYSFYYNIINTSLFFCEITSFK